MNGLIRNFVVIKVICHILLMIIWLYWGIYIHPLTFGWMNWTFLIGGGIIYFIVGGVCLILDDESDINVDNDSLWVALGYCLTNLLLLGSMMYYTSLYPDDFSLLIWPAIFVTVTLLLCGFNGVVSASLLVFLSISLWLSNWGLNIWYDYCILIGSLIIAFFSISLNSCKDYEDAKSNVIFWIINFGLSTLVNLGLLSLLYFNELLDVNNPYNLFYLAVGVILFSLVVSTRLITLLLIVVSGGIYLCRNTEFTFSSLIPDLSFEWIYCDKIKWGVGVGLIMSLIIILLTSYQNRKHNRKVEDIIRKFKRTSTFPIEYNGLTMTCPYCRKQWLEGNMQNPQFVV